MEQFITAIGAVIFVPLVLLGYIILGERVVERLPERLQIWIRPYFWALPAIGFATIFMVYPLLRTVVLSFRNNADTTWVGLNNYVYFFTFPDTLTSLRNSLLWLIFYTSISVALGLIIAILLDRVRYESLAKIAIFLPVPISAVAASIIWKFMFDYQPPGTTQTGTLNALLGLAGQQPVAFLEAARMDGANEFRIVQLIVTPLLWPTITVVGTTMIINALKTFDIVYVLTAGAYDTDVIATQMFNQLANAHYGRAAAVGVVLFVAIVPLLVVNIRRFQQQEEQR